MTLVITKCSLRTINPCNHDYPGMGRGLARSLFISVRESHNYIRVRGTPGIRIAASMRAIVNRDPVRDLSGRKTLWVS
jgi:hypothetical protein